MPMEFSREYLCAGDISILSADLWREQYGHEFGYQFNIDSYFNRQIRKWEFRKAAVVDWSQRHYSYFIDLFIYSNCQLFELIGGGFFFRLK